MPTKRPRCCVGKCASAAQASTRSCHNFKRLGSTGPSSLQAGRVSWKGACPKRSSRAFTLVLGRSFAKNASSSPAVNFIETKGVRFPSGILCTWDESKPSARRSVTWLEPEPAERVPANIRARRSERMSFGSLSNAWYTAMHGTCLSSAAMTVASDGAFVVGSFTMSTPSSPAWESRELHADAALRYMAARSASACRSANSEVTSSRATLASGRPPFNVRYTGLSLKPETSRSPFWTTHSVAISSYIASSMS
mmetsp:Transcript_63913/g.183702  ORF Transcript_63913/g.183702 Transcript_63913/m.183702 type:complete len:252 (-) Transcript_63913:1459-2214(-)